MSIQKLFPEASQTERNEVKDQLAQYKRLRKIVNELERLSERTLDQESKYKAAKQMTVSLERAVQLIKDDEVRKMIEKRYIQGERHKVVVLYYSSMHPATVNRKLNEGIREIANILKDLK